MDEQENISFKGKIVRCLYDSDNYKIYAFQVDYKYEKQVQLNEWGNIAIVGDIGELNNNIAYEVDAIEQDSKKGKQYKVVKIRRNLPTNEEQTKLFLQELLTPNQTSTIMANYPNIIDLVINNKDKEINLKKLKGIGEYTFQCIKDKIISNFKLIDLVDKFKGHIEFSTIKKLYDKYASVEKVLEVFKKNPYGCLCQLSRIGFKSADKTLLKMEDEIKEDKKNKKKITFEFSESLKTSKQRMEACIDFYLQENESNGNTWIDGDKLYGICEEVTSECTEHFDDVLENLQKYYIVNEEKVFIKSTYDIELYIANKLTTMVSNSKEMEWSINTKEYKEDEDIILTEEQMGTLDKVSKHNVSLLTAPAGCVDCDTEFFNGYEWKRISDYKEGDMVLQYEENEKASLVNPLKYHKYEAEYLTLMKNKTSSVNQVLSDEHTVVYLNDRINLSKKSFKEVKEMNEKNTNGFSGRFLTTFNYNGKGVKLSDEEIRIMIAVIADGHFRDETNSCRINLKKDRKKQRLEKLLNNSNIYFTKTISSIDGYHVYIFNAPKNEKEFHSYWYNCTNEQLKIVVDEVLYWDGSFGEGNRKSFSTTIKKSADFIQFAFSSCGYRATISTNDRTGEKYLTNNKTYTRKSKEYTVVISHGSKTVSIEGKGYKNKLEIYKTKDGFKYCFTVPSSMLVLRRNDRIFITGNSGKSQSIKMVVNMLDDNNKTYLLMTPTGKSSDVLAEYVKKEAGTIHRQLRYNPREGWGYNKDNPLNVDVVIVDEFGMVDIFLMKHLLEAIDVTRTKVIFVFDSFQLASVSCGNIAQDLLSSKIIPTTLLTKVFRYDEGGLMQVATKIRNSEKFLEDDFKGTKVFGEKKDYVYVETNQEKIIAYILKFYKKLLDSGSTYNDIMVLTCYNKGDYGTRNINTYIQALLQKNNKTYLIYGDICFYQGDKVMQTENNYKLLDADYEENKRNNNNNPWEALEELMNNSEDDEDAKYVTVYNGNMGTIQEIKKNGIVVLYKNKKVFYKKEELSQLSLAYCVSIHKSQGDSAKNIILVSPKAHTFMLNSNLLYVGVTRAKKRVYHIGNITTINQAIKKKENFLRNTFLKNMIISFNSSMNEHKNKIESIDITE